MNIPIMLKRNVIINQPSTDKKWIFGFMVSTVTAADGRPYAVIQTEHGEFELVYFNSVLACDKLDKIINRLNDN